MTTAEYAPSPEIEDLHIAIRPGDPARTPLLLMNGIGARLEALQPFVDALDPAIPVIRFDAPGIGQSPPASRPYRFSTLSARLARLVGQLGYGQVDVLGVSWGGGLAQQFAYSHPERCRRLVLVATATGSIMIPGGPRLLWRLLTSGAGPEPGHRDHPGLGHLGRIAASVYGGSAHANPSMVEGLLHHDDPLAAVAGYAHQLFAAAGWTSMMFLSRISQPTLVLAGDDDPVIPLTNARLLTQLIPNARCRIYRGGHIELACAPHRLVPAVEQHLR